MGLLNNNDYIDPFKGSDYIDPSSNAERLSNQVNRDHARRESYVQRRYVKPAQSDQASRDRQAPQNPDPSKTVDLNRRKAISPHEETRSKPC